MFLLTRLSVAMMCGLIVVAGCSRRSTPQPAASPSPALPEATVTTPAPAEGRTVTRTAGLIGVEEPQEADAPGVSKAVKGKPFDWPQWQGVDRSNRSRETGLIGRFNDVPPLVWTATGLGEGYSTPSVADGRIFCMGNKGKIEYVMAFAEATGKPIWQAEIGAVRAGGGGYPGPRCTPTVDGDRVYALGLNGDVVCVEVATGKPRWRKDLVKEFGGRVGGWGYSESPLVDAEKLIVTPGGKTAALVALNKTTGATIWRTTIPQGDYQAHYSSAIAADGPGGRQYIQFLSGGVVGVAAKDGKFLWQYTKPANGTANCSTPIFHKDGVFAASGYGTGGGMAKLSRRGTGVAAEEAYFTRSMKNHHGGMVLVDGYVYGSNEGSVTCLNFETGEIAWEERRPGKGSIAYADGKLFYRNEGGPIHLFEANPKQYIDLGKFNQPERSGSPAWPHPVIANGKLYIRDQDKLLCFDIQAK